MMYFIFKKSVIKLYILLLHIYIYVTGFFYFYILVFLSEDGGGPSNIREWGIYIYI